MNVQKGDVLQNTSSGRLWEVKSVQEDKKTVGLGNPEDNLGAFLRLEYKTLLLNYTMWRPATPVTAEEEVPVPVDVEDNVNGFRMGDIVEVLYGYGWNGRGKISDLSPNSEGFHHHVSVDMLTGEMAGTRGAFHTLAELKHAPEEPEKKTVAAKDVRVGMYIVVGRDSWSEAHTGKVTYYSQELGLGSELNTLCIVEGYGTVEFEGEELLELGDGND